MDPAAVVRQLLIGGVLLAVVCLMMIHDESQPRPGRLLAAMHIIRDDIAAMNERWCEVRPDGSVCLRYRAKAKGAKSQTRGMKVDQSEIREMHETTVNATRASLGVVLAIASLMYFREEAFAGKQKAASLTEPPMCNLISIGVFSSW